MQPVMNPDSEKNISASSKIEDHIPMNDLEQSPRPTFEEQKALKKSKYAEKSNKYPKKFLIKHKLSGRMAEVKGISPIQACSSIGWRARHCNIISVENNI